MPPVSIAYTLATGATAPTRATPGAAGMDLCAYLPDGPIRIPPGEWERIPTGLHLAIPAGYEGQIRSRSGLALKQGLTVLNSPGTIDSDYRGEVAVILINHGGTPVTIRDGDRIAQLVVCPVPAVELVPADALPPTERGSGGFGSTGPVADDDDRARRGAMTGGLWPLCETCGAVPTRHNDYKDCEKHLQVVALAYKAGRAADADDRARLEARVRALEAEVLEARAEAEKWAAELDGERAAVVAWLRSQVSQAAAAVCLAYDHAASAIAAGEHRAGGAR